MKPDQLDGLAERIQELLLDESYGGKIRAIREKYIANFGRSVEVGGQYLIDAVKEQIARRKAE